MTAEEHATRLNTSPLVLQGELRTRSLRNAAKRVGTNFLAEGYVPRYDHPDPHGDMWKALRGGVPQGIKDKIKQRVAAWRFSK